MKILLVDLSAIFWRNWHSSKDQSIGEAFNYTVNRINSARHAYDHTAVCCDCPPYKRKELSSEYKAQRDVPDPAAVGQLRRVKERLAADGLLLWESLGYEADDIIATAVHKLTDGIGDESDLSIDILTADKDLMALVSDRVTVVHLSNGDRFTPEMVREKMGVAPDMVSQLLALTGDKSDNVPGCPGIGARRGAELLREHGSITEILMIADSGDDNEQLRPPSVRQALMDNSRNVVLSWNLVRLMTDAPIDINQLFESREQKPLGEPVKDEEFEMDEFGNEAEQTKPPANDADATPLPPAPQPQAIELAPQAPLVKSESSVIMPFETSLEPRTTGQAWALAKAIHSSRLFAVESPEQALMILMTGREMGIGAMASLRGFHFIKGKPVMSAQLMAALILRSGKAEYWELVESSAKSATYATKRVGGRNEQKKTFTVEEAKLAQLVKADGNWAKYPTAMCEARAAAMLARIVYPDLLMGVYLPDEMDEVS